jgi:KUP system potassium uptake protein
MSENLKKQGLGGLILGAVGVVYGDIGTSPLYTVKEVFSSSTGILPTPENIIGAISCIFWALMFVVTLKYVILVLRADNKGEGGIIALLALAISSIGDKSQKKQALLMLGAFGAALFYGDSVITPAISVLSAIEGLEVVTHDFNKFVLPLSMVILVSLFLMQRYGTDTVGKLFGPIILIWFLTLGFIGCTHIIHNPQILSTLNPINALNFLINQNSHLFLAIGAIVLALTGAEALYADMGHFGRKAIQIAWAFLVIPSLILNYLGQGALLLQHPEFSENPFFLSFPKEWIWPAVILATLATVIASQAVISGAYSMTRQAIQLGLLPRMRIIYTSATESGQIYMPMINWLLLIAVLVATISFGSSSALASAYGIAVTATMLITTILTFFVIKNGWRYPLWFSVGVTWIFCVVDLILLASCSIKFLQGGWFPLALGFALLIVMYTWKRGRNLLIKNIQETDPDLLPFISQFDENLIQKVERTAVYLVSSTKTVPQALMHNLKHNKVLHEKNILVTVIYHEVPFIKAKDRIEVEKLTQYFWKITLHFGFMDSPNVPLSLNEVCLDGIVIDPFSTSYFVSRETIVPSIESSMPYWQEQLFAAMSRNAGSVVGYFNIPSNSVIELGTRVHI